MEPAGAGHGTSSVMAAYTTAVTSGPRRRFFVDRLIRVIALGLAVALGSWGILALTSVVRSDGDGSDGTAFAAVRDDELMPPDARVADDDDDDDSGDASDSIDVSNDTSDDASSASGDSSSNG